MVKDVLTGPVEKSETIVSAKGLVAGNDVKKLAKALNKTNHEIAMLSQQEVDNREEIKSISDEIKKLTAKLTAKKKDIKAENKSIEKKKILLLGEVCAYHKLLKESGQTVAAVDINKLLKEPGL